MTESPRQFVLSLFCLMVSVLIGSMFGCSSGRVPPKGMPKLFPCVITITQEGEPFVDAIVKFHLQGGSLNWTVTGKTDESGRAVVYTDGYFKGVPAGEYKVSVAKFETVIPPLPQVLPTDEAALLRLYNKQEADTRVYSLVEPLYNKVDSTPLSITVGKKKIEKSFDIGKKYRALSQ